jgi:hypothetical protein
MNCVVGQMNVNVITAFDYLEWSLTILYYTILSLLFETRYVIVS